MMKLEPGQKIAFKASRTNTGAVTINHRKLIALTLPDGTPLSAGELKAGQVIEFDHETGVVTLKP